LNIGEIFDLIQIRKILIILLNSGDLIVSISKFKIKDSKFFFTAKLSAGKRIR